MSIEYSKIILPSKETVNFLADAFQDIVTL